jgi:two-component system, NarL family, sensor histidine kinase LiaS
MKRVIAFFQTLRGKLILTYTLVTVLALLALEITILFGVYVVSGGINNNTLSYLSDVLTVLPAQARPYLQPDAQDLTGLQAWLQLTYDAGYASLPPQYTFDNPAAPIVKTAPMVVLSPDQTVMAAAPASAKGLVGRRYTPPSDVPRSQDILNAAQQLDFQSGHLSAIQPDGSYLLAVPVQQNPREGPLVAIIILTVQAPPPMFDSRWLVFFGIILGTALVLLIAVAPFGAVFGFIMSNGLTRRLKALTLAADAWSEGNFSVQPQDRSKDEISFLGLRMRRMAEHIQQLLQSQHELALLEERNRLARELHDTVKQETFATLMKVRAAKNLLERDPQAARAHLDDAENLIKTSQQELAKLIAELRPAALEAQGLAGALRSFLDTWSQNSRIPSDFQVVNERRLPLEIEQTFYRVAQEALSNVARHSRASLVSVRLGFDPGGQVSLQISDNGVGFDPLAVSGAGFGLSSMRDRMTALHGRLEIQPNPTGGVTLTACAAVN